MEYRTIILVCFIVLLVFGAYFLGKRDGKIIGYQKGNKASDKWYADALQQPQILTDPLGRYSIIAPGEN